MGSDSSLSHFFAFVSGSSVNDFAGVKEKLGERFQIINIWEFIESVTIDYEPGKMVMGSDLVSFDVLASARCIFYHPDSWELFFFSPLPNDTSHYFAKRQLLSVSAFFEVWLENLSSLANRPAVSRSSSNKLLQLQTLARYHPHTLIKTSLVSSKGGVRLSSVLKHISESRVINEGLLNYSQLVGLDTLKVLSENMGLPVLSQELVAEDTEYRTYFFGERNLTLQFDRGRSPVGPVDVHLVPGALTRAREAFLITEIMEDLTKVFRSFGLAYGAVDYFVTNGCLKILEVNPLPSWGWLPQKLRAKVDEAVIAFASSFPGTGESKDGSVD